MPMRTRLGKELDMNDRELLELAAKAADIEHGADRLDSGLSLTGPDGRHRSLPQWNPLTDDGDALRLAVNLRMTIRLEDPAAVIAGWAENQHVPFTADGSGPWFWKEWGRILDPEATTRRAIVRAAAEIGRSTEDTPCLT